MCDTHCHSFLPSRLHFGRDSLVIDVLVVWSEYLNAFGGVHMWKNYLMGHSVVYSLRTIITEGNESDRRRKAFWSHHHHYQDVITISFVADERCSCRAENENLASCHSPQRLPSSIAHHFNHRTFSLAVVVVTFDFRQPPPFHLSRGGHSPTF